MEADDPRQHRSGHAALVLSIAVFASACAGSGEGLDAGGRPIDESPPADNSLFQRIQSGIFTPICTQCHEGANAPEGLRLDAANSYAMLVNVPSSQVSSLLRVDPGDPAQSYLVQKLDGTASRGARMPLGGPFLSRDQIDLVREWIAGGAMPGAAVNGAAFAVIAAVPAHDEQVAPIAQLQVVFNAPVDASLAVAGAFELIAAGGDDGFDESNERQVPLAAIEVSLGNPSVVRLHTASPLTADRYRLTVHGDGPTPLADVDVRVLDGDGDGRSGGRFTSEFTVTRSAP